MQNHFGLLNTDMMPIFHNHCLDILITMRFSINCSTVICSPNVEFAILREATSEPMAPGSIFHHINFRSILFCNLYFQSIQQKYLKYLSYYLYQISLLQVVVKGLTTPLSSWLQGS